MQYVTLIFKQITYCPIPYHNSLHMRMSELGVWTYHFVLRILVFDVCYPNLSWEVKLVYWSIRMPPKRNDNKTIVNLGVDQKQDDIILNNPVQSEDRKMASFEDALDRRLKQQSKFLTDLFTKFFKTMKDELNEFGKSLIFLSSKYDEIAKSENETRESLDYLSTENKLLCERVSMLESMVAACESGMENVKQYIRRDMLELHSIPVTRDENPNEIVKSFVKVHLTPKIFFR